MSKNSQIIKCPSCKEANFISNNKLLDMPEPLYCESCKAILFPHYIEPFTQIAPDAFIHQLDKQMLGAMKKIPGIDTLLKTTLRHSFELAMRLHHQGNFTSGIKKAA